MDKVTRWWWVRHAPVTCHGGRCYGQTDLPCDVSDGSRFEGLARRLPADAVWVTSTLVRTQMTAAAIVAAGLAGPDPIPGPDVLAEADFMEQHFGDWQGVSYDELAVRRGPDWLRFWLGPAREAPPGGESFVDLMARVLPTIERLGRAHEGRDIIAVTHGGTIRAAVALALDLDPEAALALSVDNLSLTRLDQFHGTATSRNWRVATVNQSPL